MMALALAAVAFSTLLLVLLCLGDPKRRRAARLRDKGQGIATRRIIAAATVLPGIGLILIGDAAAFLLWLGGSAAAGWAITLCLSAKGESAR
ncbi:MAG: hypothetical protein QHC67_15625 [Sphingobium sp.]|uniref:hypothetical protein n=1 Tax=Sphingobium sp. TaxID=1912891 RepID=UPI0029A2B720|nr:hypothetical protein [Sphingobium sp.]MDX3911228.1 hypothetical protein [Sphingobium sp.]